MNCELKNVLLEADGRASAEIVIKKSRFIGTAVAAASDAEAVAALGAIKKQYADATHNCYAYCIGQQCNPIRYSDDGEPQGTAGLPILSVIQHTGVTNLLVVVTRYFGGTLLGAAGLARAYTQAAAEAVAAMTKLRPCPRAVLHISADYAAWSRMEESLKRMGAEISGVEYGAGVSFDAMCEPQARDAVVTAVNEASAGGASVTDMGVAIVRIPV